MQYFGGKSRIGHLIAAVINQWHPSVYLEPFCGGLWVTQHVRADRYILSDINPTLILMYRCLRSGWEPPDYVSEDEYNFYRKNQPDDPMTAFIGIGCSFSGKWFGGYARNRRGDNYAKAAKNSLLKKMKRLEGKDITFECCDFSTHTPVVNTLIYSDPPYAGTTNGYIWDTSNFWDVMRRWSLNSTCIISEYHAPEDFISIEEFHTRTEIRGVSGRDRRIEKLFLKL